MATYLVLYQSLSTWKRKVTNMDFGEALNELKDGNRVYRAGWNGVGMWLELQMPDEYSKMTVPYIYIEYPVNPKHHAYPNGSRCPWFASQTDVLSEDWQLKK